MLTEENKNEFVPNAEHLEQLKLIYSRFESPVWLNFSRDAIMSSLKAQTLWSNIKKGDLSAVVNILENGNINFEERDEASN